MNCCNESRTRALSARGRQRFPLLFGLTVLGSLSAAADVPSGGPYTMRKQVVASGGGTASSGPYRLVGTVAQSAVGPVAGDGYALQQGFHTAASAEPAPLLFQDSFESTGN